MSGVIHIRLVAKPEIIDQVLALLPKHSKDKVLSVDSFPMDHTAIVNAQIDEMLDHKYGFTTLDTYLDLCEQKFGTRVKHAFDGLREVVLSKHAFSWQLCNTLKACFFLWPTLVYDIKDKDGLFLHDCEELATVCSYDHNVEGILHAVYRVNTQPVERLHDVARRYKALKELATGGHKWSKGYIAGCNGGLGNGNTDVYGWAIHHAADEVFAAISQACAYYDLDRADCDERWYAAELIKDFEWLYAHDGALRKCTSLWEERLMKTVYNAAQKDVQALHDLPEAPQKLIGPRLAEDTYRVLSDLESLRR